MIRAMRVKNFTIFEDAEFKFGKNLNIVVGENGTGKTHVLKLAYAVTAASWEAGRKPGTEGPTKSALETRIADKLVGTFRPDSLGRLTRRRQGRGRCEVQLEYSTRAWDVGFHFSTHSRADVSVHPAPSAWVNTAPAYIPTRELLSIYPGFVAVYEGHYLEFEETWRDTCLLLGAPLKRGAKERRVEELLKPIERSMGGRFELDKNGRFYFVSPFGRMETPLVAEGVRKLGMLARLIATGALLDKGYLFWDEPEANLNARLIREVARSIVQLSLGGIQVFIATHSLFLLRELEILLAEPKAKKVDVRFFGLQRPVDEKLEQLNRIIERTQGDEPSPAEDRVLLRQGASVDDIGDLAALAEDLAQSDRFLSVVP